jgi:hypothetical protein
VALACSPSYSGGRGRRITDESQAWQSARPYPKNKNQKQKDWMYDSSVRELASEALCSIPSTGKAINSSIKNKMASG